LIGIQPECSPAEVPPVISLREFVLCIFIASFCRSLVHLERRLQIHVEPKTVATFVGDSEEILRFFLTPIRRFVDPEVCQLLVRIELKVAVHAGYVTRPVLRMREMVLEKATRRIAEVKKIEHEG